MAENGMKWYAMRASSGKEHKLKEYIEAELSHNDFLRKNVGEVLLPMEKHVSIKNGKRVVKEKVALAGYLFIQANLVGDTAHELRFMPNCLGFIGGLDHPTPVPEAQIRGMIGQAEGSEIMDEVEIPYMLDEVVKVTDGPFTDFTGIIEKIDTEKHSLTVVVKIFGRNTPLELDYTQVEKIGNPEV